MLELVLREDGSAAQAIREAVHRATLWKIRKGRTKPGRELAILLRDLSNGRISIEGWTPVGRATARSRRSSVRP
jgi:hypothetical protein